MRFNPLMLEKCQIRTDEAISLIRETKCDHLMRAAKLDANETLWSARELTQIKKFAYEVQYPEFLADELVPVDSEGNTGSNELGYDMLDVTGEAAVVNDKPEDYPDIEISKEQVTAPVKTLGAKIEWNIQQVRSATLATMSGVSSNYSFTQRKTDAAMKAIRQKEERIVFTGDAKHGLIGFFNNTNIPTVAASAGAAGEGKMTDWATKTPFEIIKDLNNIMTAIVTNSKGTFRGNTLCLTHDSYEIISSTPFAGTGGTPAETLLSFFTKKSQAIIPNFKIYSAPRLQWAASGTAKRKLVAYKRDPMVVSQQIPQPLEIFGPEPLGGGTSFRTFLRERHGGIHLRYPVACAQMEYGVGD